MASGAQREIRDLSNAIYSILKKLFPLCSEVFEEHTLHSNKFGKTEMSVLLDIVSRVSESELDELCLKHDLPKSRVRELKGALGFNNAQ
jgi:thymidylate synthase ThyX